ncbi:MAG TPA: hypothetical protein VH916_14500, partial [Dehalococcoidia bacterium]
MALYTPVGWLDPATQEIAGALTRLSEADLLRVAAARGLELSQVRGVDLATRRTILATQLTATSAVQLALAALTHRDLSVLQTVWRAGPLRPDQLVERLRAHTDAATVEASLQRLRDLLLVVPAA